MLRSQMQERRRAIKERKKTESFRESTQAIRVPKRNAFLHAAGLVPMRLFGSLLFVTVGIQSEFEDTSSMETRRRRRQQVRIKVYAVACSHLKRSQLSA